MKKRICLIVTFILLFNFVMSSFSISFAISNASYWIQLQDTRKQTFYLSKEAGLNGGENVVRGKANASGVYMIAVSNKSSIAPFDIVDSSDKPLMLATCTGGNSNRLEQTVDSGAVQVYIKKDTEFRIRVYSDAIDTSMYVITVNKKGDSGVTCWRVASSIYSSAGSRSSKGDTTVTDIHKENVKDPDGALPTASSKGNGGNVDFVQKVISWIFTYGIADPLRGIITLLFGNVTIDNLLFNKYTDTKLAFYPENGRGTAYGNKVLESPSLDSGLLHMVSEYYAIFRSIAVTFYLIMLLYIGVRILLKSTARDKEKYKTMLSDWLTGVIILLFFPYAIKYLIILNETLIGVLEEKVVRNADASLGISNPSASVDTYLLIAMGQVSEGGGENKGLMLSFREKTIDTGNLGYAFVYIYLLVKLFGFVIFYYKRLITVLFLIVLFPFVAISYCLDKVKDGKAQIFGNWLKEFLLNVYIQFFQAVLWIIVMFVVDALISGDADNPVLICIGIGFVSKGDAILRALFPSLLGGGGANTVSPVEKTAQTAIAKRMIDNASKKTQNTMKRFKDAKQSFSNVRKERDDKKLNSLEDRVQNQEKRLAAQVTEPLEGEGEGGPSTILDEATIKRNEGVSSNEPSATADPKRDANLDKKFEAMQQLVTGLSLEQTAGNTQDALAQRMDKMSPAEKDKLMHELKVARATRELVTGKSADGRTLTRLELGLSANIVFEAMTSNDAKNRDAKRWLNNRKITVGKKVPVSSSIKTKEDAAAWEKKHGRSAYKIEKTEMDLKDYLAFSDSKGGAVGQGLKGKVLTKDQQSQMQAGDAFLGGRSGLHTGRTVEGDVDSITGQKIVGTRSNEGKDVGADKVISLTNDEKERSHQRTDSKGASMVDKMVKSYAGDVDATSSDREEVEEAANLIMELAEYNERLHSSDPAQKAEGVSADEALRITDELTKMSKSNRRVARMVQESVSTDKTGTTYKKQEMVSKKGHEPKKVEKVVKRTAVEETSKGIKVNLGVSVEGLRAMSAKTVLTDKKMDSETRTGSTQDAIEVLQEVAERVSSEDEFLDAIEAATYERSEMDAYLGDDAVISTGFSLGDGLVRDERSNEQILSDAFMKDIQARSESDAAAKVAAMKRDQPRKMVKAVANITDATVGNVVRGAATITVDALYLGADRTPTMKEFGVATAAGMGIGSAVSGQIQKKAKGLDTVLEEREHRKKVHEAQKAHTEYNKYNERSKNAKGAAAARNINAFKDKLS